VIEQEEKAIEMYQDLSLNGAEDELGKFFEELTSHLQDGWTRSEIDEQKANGLPYPVIKFHCTEKTGRKPAYLWFSNIDPKTWEISNIVPDKPGKLSHTEYNAVLDDFFHSFVEGNIRKFDLSVHKTNSFRKLSEFLPKNAFQSFLSFTNLANKSTGYGHPLDEKRWLHFLFCVHEKAPLIELDASLFERFLEESFDWPAKNAYKLSVDFEHSLTLLKAYDNFKNGNRKWHEL